MKQITIDKLKRLEATYPKKAVSVRRRNLKVFYGWSKINKIQKREAIEVLFENEEHAGDETRRSYKTMIKGMEPVYVRQQTEKEMQDAVSETRVFTAFYVFMDHKMVNGSLEKALYYNSVADENHISEEERNKIADALRRHYLIHHPGYKEPSQEK